MHKHPNAHAKDATSGYLQKYQNLDTEPPVAYEVLGPTTSALNIEGTGDSLRVPSTMLGTLNLYGGQGCYAIYHGTTHAFAYSPRGRENAAGQCALPG